MKENKVAFTINESGEEVEFFVIEETQINNVKYLLVTEDDITDSDTEDDAEAYILKDTSDSDSSEAVYEMVEDDKELEYVSDIFAEILDDIDFEK